MKPVVAMFLGWALADEPVTFRSVVAAAIILRSVVVITTDAASGRASRTAPEGRTH